MNTNITISASASSYIKKKQEQHPGAGFRLSIKKTGCSGYSYVPEMTEKINSNDIVQEINGMTIYVDSAWLHLLQGIHIDYVEEEKSGLKQKRLVFINPNESSRCGCGESFHVSNDHVS